MSKGGRESGQGEQRAVGGEENWEIAFPLGGEGPQQQEGEKGKNSQNMHVGMRRRGVHHTGGNQET